ncbi:hypothetical protein O6H91_16G082400 [Diphasiastrum complanatum]|uniref:Uncharacterized protein n=1 Tax=Diphasiastrum complanatum TaxID=34168 RepID=A0ACC2BE34_DIPCM|nr:hypothetical protein O6H91_16G082400 [Diphasiastrum complanatum]
MALRLKLEPHTTEQHKENECTNGFSDHLQLGDINIPRLIEDCLENIGSARGKVCILSIDGGGMRGIIAGRMLAYLEEALQRKSGNPEARIADYFDIAAGTSTGGIIATMLFTADQQGRPLFKGEDTWKLIAEKGKSIFSIPFLHRPFAKLRGLLSPRYSAKNLQQVLKEILARDGRPLTLRDTLKALLIPCYDLNSAGPFLFSRAGAFDSEAWDFPLWEICRATTAAPSFFKPAKVTSMDCKTTCTAVDGGLVMNNPTGAAITHVLHNKLEFPAVRGVRDLLVLSLGTGQFDQTYHYKKVRRWGAFQWAKPIVNVMMDGISDMVDQIVSMAFGASRQNYLRIQASGLSEAVLSEMDDPSARNVKRLLKLADDLLQQNSSEYLPFGGKMELVQTNAERLDWFADQLIHEHKARIMQKLPPSATSINHTPITPAEEKLQFDVS